VHADVGVLVRGTRAVDRRMYDLKATILRTAVDRARGNLSSAARMIGLTRRQLAYRLKST